MYPNSGAAPTAMRAFTASLGTDVTACDGSSPLPERAQALAGSESSPRWLQAVMPPDRAGVARIGQEPFDAVYTCGMLQHLTHHELSETAAYIRQSVTKNAVVIVVVPLELRGETDRFLQSRNAADYTALLVCRGFQKVFERICATGFPGYECPRATLVYVRANASNSRV